MAMPAGNILILPTMFIGKIMNRRDTWSSYQSSAKITAYIAS
jgi:hypothetical protein